MRICIVADNIYPKAGLGRMILSITDRLQERGHSIGYVLLNGESDSNTIVVNSRISLRFIFRTILDLFKMRSFAKNYDVIISFDVQPAGILAYLSTFGLNKIVIIHSLGTYSLFTPSNKIKNKLIYLAYKNANRVFIINDFVKRKIEQSNSDFSFGTNITFVPVGVDTTLFKVINSSNDVRHKDYIITVGAIKPRKGQLESVKAFSSMANFYPDLHYFLVGSITDSPNYYNMIVDYVSKNNLSDKVTFIQNISDEKLIDLYNGAKFFVLTPASSDVSIEGFGMVYLESALCGITSIGTFDTGAEAAIINNETGILVDRDVSKIEKAMKTLLDEDNLREEYAHNAKLRALTFNWNRVVDLYESELTNLIKK